LADAGNKYVTHEELKRRVESFIDYSFVD